MRVEDIALLDDLATCLEYPGSGYEQKRTLAGRHRALDETPALRRMGHALSGLALYLSERGKDAAKSPTRGFSISRPFALCIWATSSSVTATREESSSPVSFPRSVTRVSRSTGSFPISCPSC